jgi:hypothetical protein
MPHHKSKRPPRSRRLEIAKPQFSKQTPQRDRFWKSPWTWLGALIAIVAIAIPVYNEIATKLLIVALSLDSSASALADVKPGEGVCRGVVQRLRAGDTLLDIPYAETTEVARNSEVSSPTAVFPRCDEYRDRKIAGRLGKANGTSPMLLFDRVNNNIMALRKQGNTNAIIAIVYLQEAEPGPNLPALNFDELADKLAWIQKQRGWVVLIGPTGDLRERLDEMNSKRPDLKNFRLCAVAEQDRCIREAFDAARRM